MYDHSYEEYCIASVKHKMLVTLRGDESVSYTDKEKLHFMPETIRIWVSTGHGVEDIEDTPNKLRRTGKLYIVIRVYSKDSTCTESFFGKHATIKEYVYDFENVYRKGKKVCKVLQRVPQQIKSVLNAYLGESVIK